MSTLDAVKNFSKVTVSGTYNESQYQITVSDGTRFPDPAVSGQYNIVWYNDTDFPDPADDPNVEILRVIAVNGNVLTLSNDGSSRTPQEGTSTSTKNQAHKTYKIILGITAKTITDIQDNIDAINNAGYITEAQARASISSGATGLSYSQSTGVISIDSGYAIPTNGQISNWNAAYGWGNHANAGYALLSGANFGGDISAPNISVGTQTSNSTSENPNSYNFYTAYQNLSTYSITGNYDYQSGSEEYPNTPSFTLSYGGVLAGYLYGYCYQTSTDSWFGIYDSDNGDGTGSIYESTNNTLIAIIDYASGSVTDQTSGDFQITDITYTYIYSDSFYDDGYNNLRGNYVDYFGSVDYSTGYISAGYTITSISYTYTQTVGGNINAIGTVTAKSFYDGIAQLSSGVLTNAALSSCSGNISQWSNDAGYITSQPWSSVTDGINYASGKVGIGVSAPADKLSVNGIVSSGSATFDGEIRSYQSNSFPTFYVSLKTDTVAAKSGLYRSGANFFNYYDTNTADVVLDAVHATVGSLLFKINNVEKMRINRTTGNVGIGTTSPAYKLDVWGSTGIISQVKDSTTAANTNFTTDSAGRAFLNVTGQAVGGINGGAYLTANGYQESYFNLVANANTTGKRYMRFGTQYNGTYGNMFVIQNLNDSGGSINATPFALANNAPSNSFVMDSTGKIGIGTISPAALLHGISTTEQLRLGYGTSNYFKATVDSTGITTFDGAGSGASFVFNKKVSVSNPVNLKNYTVATLPTGVRGDVAYVTDALAPTYLTAIVGGGAIVTPVFYDGTNWVAY